MKSELALIACALLVGCAGADYDEASDEALELRDLLSRPDDHQAPWATAPANDPPTDEQLAGSLSPTLVADLAVRRNPDVVAALERWVGFLERAPQRAAPPDPTFRYGYSSMFDMHSYGVMQDVPFPAKLAADARAALAEARAARADFHEQQNVLRAQATTALANLYLVRRSLELLDENLVLVERFVEIAGSKYAAGTATQADVLRAQVGRDTLRADRAGFVGNNQEAESALNVLLDRRPDAPLGRVESLPDAAAPEALVTLFERADRARPALAAARERIEVGRELLWRAELEWAPDFAFGGAYVRDFGEDEDEVELTGGISLPIWFGRIRAGVREAEAGVRQAEAEARSTRNQVLDEVRRAYARLDAARERARILGDEALPRAEQNVQVSEAAYVAGQLDFLELIDAQRALLDAELALERARAERTTAEAELRQAVGETVPLRP